MSGIPEFDPGQSRILNAKRYGLSADDLNRFTEIMSGLREKGEAEVKDVPETDAERAVRIKDYMVERIAGHLSSLYQPKDQPKSAQDLMFDLMSPRDDKGGTDWSGFLNMHFDLDTLQMLNNS